MKNEIKISVRNLIEFVLRTGDIDTTFISNSRAVEGTKAHRKIQNSYGENYQSEVALKHSFSYEGFSITIEGRADGILIENEKNIIDEIKSTTKDLDTIEEDYNELHWAQGKCYGYIYCIEKDLEEIDVQLTYYELDSQDTKIFRKNFSKSELEKFYYDLIDKYLIWVDYILNWNKIRDLSIEKMDFPFESYRKGQREMSIAVYKTILHEKNLFVQAPTGIGKTVSVLFPTIKSIREGLASKIFYLTAKTITRQAALNCVYDMRNQGLRLKSMVITAKEKICLNEEVDCNPEKCPYAKGHFDRVNQAVLDVLQNKDTITRETIEYYATKYKVCPFELSLDISIFADLIICDYNYVFDPRVSLKRFFEENNEDYVFLIDEAHNLVDRARGMYSAELTKEPILEYRKYFKEKNTKLYRSFNKINSFFLKAKKWCNEEGVYVSKNEIEEFYPLIRKASKNLEEWLLENKKDPEYREILNMYFELLGYLRIAEYYNETYVTYIEHDLKDVKIKLFCLDPSIVLGEVLKNARGSIFFSGTLTPLDYFKEILGGNKKDYTMRLSSPFDRENLCLLITNEISTRYRDRPKSYPQIVKYIEKIVEKKQGNYFVFFPSYKYMMEVYEIFKEQNTNYNTIIQEFFMDEKSREKFIKSFEEKDNLIGFAVLGGIFSEGIDLIGDNLIGAIIVGVGLPQLCFERNIIMDYFKEKNGFGYQYAYMYPGMNKVLQAAGRVIRTEEDKGIILLIDDRFLSYRYLRLFPKEWKGFERVSSVEVLGRSLDKFWERKF